MKKSKDYFAFSLFTLAAGFLAGLLLAPDSGKNTRKQLLEKIKAYTNDFDDITNTSKEVYKNVKESIVNLKDNPEETINKFLNKN